MKMSGLLLIILFTFIPATAFAGESDNTKIKCAELCQNFSNEFKEEYVSGISIWGNPEFHYNRTLGLCLVYTEIIDGALNKEINSLWYHRRITDVYSNKVLAYSRYFIDKNDPTKKETLVNLANVGDAANFSSEIFAAKKTELFGQ